MEKNQSHRRRRRLLIYSYVLFKKTQRYMPPVVRGLLGVLLMLMGILGFLPILGFWMIPLGFALLATDIPPLKRWYRSKVKSYRKNLSQ